MKLEEVRKITGEIHCISNLHIGGSSDIIEIGGLDNPVIKHPISNEPYIPGSSLKGKMRCSAERKKGLKEVCSCGNPKCPICVLFGCSKNGKADNPDDSDKNHKGELKFNKYPPLGPTRLIVRDAPLTQDSRDKIDQFVNTEDQDYMGVKHENVIKRETGLAEHPRPIEFVPAGTDFLLNISLLVYDIDPEKEYITYIKEALIAVEDTYLGGMGSRGYGQVEFRDMKLDGEDFTLRGTGD